MLYYGISQEGKKAFTQQCMQKQGHMPTHRALMGKLGGENCFIHDINTLHICAKWVPHRGFPGEGPFGIVTANVTAWSSATKWLEEDGDSFELLCIQEHHLSSSDDIKSAKANGLLKGFQSCLAPALDTGLGDGTTGGVGFIWPHHVRIICPGDIIQCHWGMSVQLDHHSLGQIIVVSFYGHPKDKIITFRRLDDILQKLCDTGFSFIIAGDFNVSCEDMASWLPDNYPHTQIREAGDSCFTATGSTTIDYFIFHGPVCTMKSSVQTLDTSLATHRPVEVTFDSWTNGEKVRWMTKHPRPNADLVVGPSVNGALNSKWENHLKEIQGAMPETSLTFGMRNLDNILAYSLLCVDYEIVSKTSKMI